MGLQAVPDWIGELKNLQSLGLWENRLSSLPETISELRDLEMLSLSGNGFEQLPGAVLDLSASGSSISSIIQSANCRRTSGSSQG
jgi:Leucine-rich repeat (LRR) protein